MVPLRAGVFAAALAALIVFAPTAVAQPPEGAPPAQAEPAQAEPAQTPAPPQSEPLLPEPEAAPKAAAPAPATPEPAAPAAPQAAPQVQDEVKRQVETHVETHIRETRVLGVGAMMGQRVEVGDRSGAVAAFAEEILVPGRVGGDVFAAGRTIEVSGAVDGDLRAMGERINITGDVAGEASLAAEEIEVARAIGRDLNAAGRAVTLSEAAHVSGDAHLAGQSITMRGRVVRDLDAAGEEVTIDGAIDGDAEVRARRLVVGPNADIAGRLTWRAAAPPEIDPAAKIAGGSEGAVGDWREHHVNISPEAKRAFGVAARICFAIMWALSAFLIGLVLALAAPAYFDRALAGLRAKPLPALGWGLLMLIAPVALAIVLMATLIGIPLAIFTLFAYPLFLAAGYGLGAASFAALAVRGESAGARLGALALGLVVFGALSFIPWFGGAFAFVAIWLGLGLLIIALRRETPPGTAGASPA